jgi:membrane protease YdiL (CAAX protease family)
MKGRLEQMARTLQRNQNLQNQLCTVPILAETSNAETALAELKRLQAKPTAAAIEQDLQSFQQLYDEGEASLSAQQRKIIMNYGWFGRLALSQEEPDSDPARKAVLQSAFRMVVILAIFTIAIVAGLIAGLAVLATAIVFLSKGKLRSRLAIPAIPGDFLLQGFAIYITGFMALPGVVALLIPRLRLGASILAFIAVIFALFWPRIRGANWKEFRKTIGWHRGEGFFREIGCGIAGYLAGLPLLAVAAALVALLSRYTGVMPVHPLINQASRNPFYLLFLTALACIWAPIVEETFFRGVLFGYLRRHLSWVFSGVITALVFALIHPQGLLGAPAIGMIGFTLSAIREWRGSLIASMSAHALNNGSVMLLLIFILD